MDRLRQWRNRRRPQGGTSEQPTSSQSGIPASLPPTRGVSLPTRSTLPPTQQGQLQVLATKAYNESYYPNLAREARSTLQKLTQSIQNGLQLRQFIGAPPIKNICVVAGRPLLVTTREGVVRESIGSTRVLVQSQIIAHFLGRF
jgi:hypothetical protein